jgi:hypothetical protein
LIHHIQFGPSTREREDRDKVISISVRVVENRRGAGRRDLVVYKEAQDSPGKNKGRIIGMEKIDPELG